MNEVYLSVTVSDGSVVHYAFQTAGRFPDQPKGNWSQNPTSAEQWSREATNENIEFELSRAERLWANREVGGAVLVGWRRLSDDEHEQFNSDRPYRNALRDDGKKIHHDMNHARELHRDILRKHRSYAIVDLDGQWMRATGQNKKAEADAIDARRQKWRDAPTDPRIDAAKTIDDLKKVMVE